VLLTVLRERHNPWSWFLGDWPLSNHFYRPISTLVFELDQFLYGKNAAGYGWTNALLVVASVLALFWFLRELLDEPLAAAGGATLFALWCVDRGDLVAGWLGLAAVPVLLVGIWRHRMDVRQYAAAPLMIWFLSDELVGKSYLYGRCVQWLPGRTATVMTVFALIAMAAYARFVRLAGSERIAPVITPLTPPATRNTRQEVAPRQPWGWLLVAALGTMLALGSYEQAVMMPFMMLGIALAATWRNRTVDYRWMALFVSIVGAYLAYRHAVVPSDPSGYQKQQFRMGGGVFLGVCDYASPFVGTIPSLWLNLGTGPLLWLTAEPYRILFLLAQEATTYYQARRAWALPLVGYLMSLGAYAPMAFFKPFDHYHFWPMALRTVFVVSLLPILAGRVVSAWSRPEQSAPPRRIPAPGSLPRP